ncbi:hypothetical protein D3C80_1745000 [compost metagenome]
MMWIIQKKSQSRQVLVLAPATSPVTALRISVVFSLSANSTRQAGSAKSRVSRVGFSTSDTEVTGAEPLKDATARFLARASSMTMRRPSTGSNSWTPSGVVAA